MRTGTVSGLLSAKSWTDTWRSEYELTESIRDWLDATTTIPRVRANVLELGLLEEGSRWNWSLGAFKIVSGEMSGARKQ